MLKDLVWNHENIFSLKINNFPELSERKFCFWEKECGGSQVKSAIQISAMFVILFFIGWKCWRILENDDPKGPKGTDEYYMRQCAPYTMVHYFDHWGKDFLIEGYCPGYCSAPMALCKIQIKGSCEACIFSDWEYKPFTRLRRWQFLKVYFSFWILEDFGTSRTRNCLLGFHQSFHRIELVDNF